MSTCRGEKIETPTSNGCSRPSWLRSAGVAGRITIAALLAFLATAPVSAAELVGATPAHGYRFGVFPYVPALTIDRIFGPIAARFAADLGQPVYLKTKSNFNQFAEQLAKEDYDIIFVHPFFYVHAADHCNYLPLARLEGELQAVVLVAQDQPWRDWGDLGGKTIALPPPLAAVSEMARVALMAAGLTPGIDVWLKHYRTKVSCLQAVTMGAADACVLPEFVLPQILPMGETRLRIMARTPPINHLIFAVHTRLPAADRATLLRSILSWPDTAEGQKILATGAWPRFLAAEDADYDQVRRYGAQLGNVAQR